MGSPSPTSTLTFTGSAVGTAAASGISYKESETVEKRVSVDAFAAGKAARVNVLVSISVWFEPSFSSQESLEFSRRLRVLGNERGSPPSRHMERAKIGYQRGLGLCVALEGVRKKTISAAFGSALEQRPGISITVVSYSPHSFRIPRQCLVTDPSRPPTGLSRSVIPCSVVFLSVFGNFPMVCRSM